MTSNGMMTEAREVKAGSRRLAALALAVAVGPLAAVAGAEYPELPLRLTSETPQAKAARMAWWRQGRFGMFVHFGLYAMAARHEQVKLREAIADETYDSKYFARFNPDLFDARAWAKAAKAAGMRYMVLTVKHHEGFCLWDTKTTDYRITKTPFGRDLVREYVDACRDEGLRVGFYFSLIDWHSPDYTLDYKHPRHQALCNRGLRGEALEREVARLNAGRDMARFRRMMFAQVTELLSDYGKIDVIWYDFTPKAAKFGKTYRDWDAVELVRLTRRLQPDIIMDNRLDLMDTEDGWDFVTPEQFKVQSAPTVRGQPVPWETCQTFSGSWGYYRDETSWKDVPQLISLLVHSVSKGGNLILNVGPTARGEFDARATDRLNGLARWMHANGRAIYGCGPAPEGFVAPEGTMLTYNAATKTLYLHLMEYPLGFLPISFWDRLAYAQFLHDGSELFVRPPPKRHSQSGEQKGDFGGLTLPVERPAGMIPVVELKLKGE